MTKLLALAAVATIALGVAGCGKTVLDATKTEEQLESSLGKTLPAALEGASGAALSEELDITSDTKVESVECPTDVEVEKGTTFTCTITFANGAEAIETLKIVNEDADLDALGLSAPAK